mmetsp:Transcript_2181/g.3631  ORF Transcript_2181/g.3631 Transcript_2181/m.3631 type:complete len:251 (-) Transcript_2181:47-799(-)|eukprot:CAMPEP_0184522508 /NCGR_PEP_ID=MMETSP0198_2-20121128/8318_1 /TAXON_ID=1112570 /ORGANISM="Thraustochytrium sp., Strain LLF1b" /LENGTH=250 /DNA_ID=CAMNT_0026913337 /DNA_START=270 /DNA_END=1022 /DNA_ORIENTATION=+
MSDPTTVAQAFVTAYNTALETANAQALSGFFQDASTMSFEGDTCKGKQAIVEKLSKLGLPADNKRRVTSCDAQLSCCGNGSLIVFVTGEWMKQQYQEAFQLVPNGNSFYAHNGIFRVGNNNQFNIPPEAQELTKSFIQFYYATYDKGPENRDPLRPLYTPNSLVDYEGTKCVGPDAIIEKLKSLPAVQHDLNNVVADVQLVNGLEIVLVMLCGGMTIDGANPLKFSQCFVLQKNGGSYIVGNQVFRLNYG